MNLHRFSLISFDFHRFDLMAKQKLRQEIKPNKAPMTDPKVDQYLIDGCMRCKYGATPQCKVNDWREVLVLLRQVLQETELTETLKWGVPCYTWNDKNIVVLSALRDACTLGFFKGALLEDPEGLLQQPGANSQATRYLKFTDPGEVTERIPTIQAFLSAAIALEQSGQKVVFKKQPEPMPEELREILSHSPELSRAFFALTPGRQRGYILHFSQPKQSATRISRIEKCRDKILRGEGFHDRDGGTREG